MNVSVVVPALNEEEPIGTVVREIIATGIPREVVVVDNESTDRTADEAKSAGADVVSAPRGYGRACAAGAAAVSKDCDVIVFLDGDGSDVPALMPSLLDPIYNGTYDFVIGSRSRGQREPGSMNFQQVFAGYLAGFLIHLLYGVRYTDMCAFRAIRRDADESGAEWSSHSRSSGSPPPTRWRGFEGLGHIAGHVSGRVSNRCDFSANRAG